MLTYRVNHTAAVYRDYMTQQLAMMPSCWQQLHITLVTINSY